MAKTPPTPQVPGETNPVVVEDPAAPAADAGGDTVTVDRASLEAMQAQIAKLQELVAAGPARPAIARQENLPDQTEIDQATIARPVLSKQGWVVPVKYGSHPNQPK